MSALRVTPLGDGPDAEMRRAVEQYCRQAEASLQVETAKAIKFGSMSALVQLTHLDSWLVPGSIPAQAFEAARADAPAGQGWDKAAKAQQAELDALRESANVQVRYSDAPEAGETAPQRRARQEGELAAHESAMAAIRDTWQLRSSRPAPIVATVLDYLRKEYNTDCLKADGAGAVNNWRLDVANIHSSGVALRIAASRAGGIHQQCDLYARFLNALAACSTTAAMAAQIEEEFKGKGVDPQQLTLSDALDAYQRRANYDARRGALTPAEATPHVSQPPTAARDPRAPRQRLAAPAQAGPLRLTSDHGQRPRCSVCSYVGPDASQCHVRDEAAWRNSPYFNGSSRDEELNRRRDGGRAPRAQFDGARRTQDGQMPSGANGGRHGGQYQGGRGGRFGGSSSFGGRLGLRSGSAVPSPQHGTSRREPALSAQLAALEARLIASEERQAQLFAAQADTAQQRASATSLPLLIARATPTAAFAGPTTRTGPKGGLRKVNGVPIPESFLPAAPAAAGKKSETSAAPKEPAPQAAPAKPAAQPLAAKPADTIQQVRRMAPSGPAPEMRFTVPNGCEISFTFHPETDPSAMRAFAAALSTASPVHRSELLGGLRTAHGTGQAAFILVECSLTVTARRVLLDCGSQLCGISEALALQLGLHPSSFHDPQLTVNGVTGSAVPREALYADVTVAPGTESATTINTELVVLPGTNDHFDLLLGIPHLQASDSVLDFGNSQVTMQTNAGGPATGSLC